MRVRTVDIEGIIRAVLEDAKALEEADILTDVLTCSSDTNLGSVANLSLHD
jgi:hypothetical protein